MADSAGRIATMRSRTIETPIGSITLAGTLADDGTDVLHHVVMEDQAHAPDPSDWVEEPGAFADLVNQLNAYFAGDLTRFDVVTSTSGTEFQEAVWAGLRAIPYGETWSYLQLATHIGRPTAVRAVGLANGRNPVPIVVACHRVVGADGSLTGYAGGVERKRELLDLEQRR